MPRKYIEGSRSYRNYTDEDIIQKSKQVNSMAQLLKELGLIAAGGNYHNIKKNLIRLNIDTSHWLGQGWRIGQQQKNFEDYILPRSTKKHLIYLRGHKCENCQLTEWQNKQIPLELDHVDGDRTNNEENNLKLLCPNCHAQTNTWRGRKYSI